MNPDEAILTTVAIPSRCDAGACPLCGGATGCVLEDRELVVENQKSGNPISCWCRSVNIPDALLARVPVALRNRACICARCVADFHRQQPAALPGDFYFDAGLMVFTAPYHLRRGYCCGNGCRHCPFPVSP